MISIHPQSDIAPVGTHFSSGFQVAETSDMRLIARYISTFAWSGNAWQNGYRLAANFLYSDWCVLDIDDEMHVYPLAQALRNYSDSVHIIGITRNHQKNKNGITCDRYRIAVPWERRITERENYEGNMRELRAKNEAIDGSTLSAAQHFFPCAKIISVMTDGYLQRVSDARHSSDTLTSDDYSRWLGSKRTEFMVFERLPHWVVQYLEHGVAQAGSRHRRALGVAVELVECGLDPAEVVAMIAAAPISRPWAQREVGNVVRYAVQLVAGRLRDGEKEVVEEDRIKSRHLSEPCGDH